jgi:signal transduction histidine kinase
MDQQELHNRVRKTAHDVRTPITTIAGFADLLAEDNALPEGSRDIAATIVAETRRLSDMLEAFFDELSSKPEAE